MSDASHPPQPQAAGITPEAGLSPSDEPARGPIRVAHRGGNSASALRRALRLGLDWIEADIWLHYGRLVARHDRSVWRLPISYSRTSLRLNLAPAVVLDTILRASAATPTHILIDLKGDHPGLPAAIVRLLEQRDAFARTALCGTRWELLDQAQQINPAVRVFYSLARPEHLEAYLSRRATGTAPPLASCRHTLLTPASVAALKEVGSTVIAWTVDSEARARQLLAWGVDGITSNRYEMLARLGGGRRALTPGPHAPD